MGAGEGTFNVCPVLSPAPVPSPFACARSTRLIPSCLAIELSVSPFFTTYVLLKIGGCAGLGATGLGATVLTGVGVGVGDGVGVGVVAVAAGVVFVTFTDGGVTVV